MTDDELIDSLKGFTLGKWAVDGSPGIDGKHDVWVSWDEIICENARPEDAALIAAAPDLHRIALERGAEIARLRGAEGWQPIETAPIDNTPHVRGLWIMVNSAGKGIRWECVAGSIDRSEGEFFDHDSNTPWRADEYSHWMPLPAAPDA